MGTDGKLMNDQLFGQDLVGQLPYAMSSTNSPVFKAIKCTTQIITER